HRSETDTRLRTAATLLAAPASDLLAGRADPQQVLAHLKDLGEATRLRLTVIRSDGTVLADSEAALPLTNHADRPEIVEASSSGEGFGLRRSATTGHDTRYFAKRLDQDGKELGFIRAAAEFEEMERAIGALRETLVLGGLVAFVVG